MKREVLNAQKRIVVGRKVKNLRKQDILPGNIYGKKIKSLAVAVAMSEFSDIYRKVGETNLIDLVIKNGKADERAVLISNVQKNPVSGNPVHVDFRQVDLKEKVAAKIPVELTGEAPAEKQGLGTVVQYLNEVEIEALPTDLPDKFVVDIAKLAEVDQAVLVKELPIDKAKIELKTDAETILIKVEPPQKEEEVAPPLEAEVPAEGAPVEEGAAVPAEEGAPTGEQPAEEAAPKEEK
jgi:large subunit ribosomal protein L25